MGLIQAPPDEIAGVGSGIEALAPEIGGVLTAARSLGTGVSDPPATAAALGRMSTAWASAAERLGDDIAALGRATGATAVAYRVADESSMGGGGPPLIPASTSDGGGGGGGGGSW